MFNELIMVHYNYLMILTKLFEQYNIYNYSVELFFVVFSVQKKNFYKILHEFKLIVNVILFTRFVYKIV